MMPAGSTRAAPLIETAVANLQQLPLENQRRAGRDERASDMSVVVFFFQAEDGIRDLTVTGVQTCALPIFRLAAQLGSNLSGVLYVLDEPTIGLHARDNEQLLAVLQKLKSRGNSVVVVEHEDRKSVV